MKNKQLPVGLASALAMLVLILDGKTALEGANQGVLLCLVTVIPSLFPFFLLSTLLTSSLLGTSLAALRPLGRLCGVPKGGESMLVAAFLGGYPAGAQAVAEGYRMGALEKESAQRMLSFCNQPGPAFLFGMVSFLFPRPWMAWALWGIVFLSAVLTAQIFSGGGRTASPLPAKEGATLSSALWTSLRSMAAVCGWVVVFRVVLAFLTRWFLWLVPSEVQTALTGLLELSNGCMLLGQIADLKLRFCVAAGMLAFGGLCVMMQALSVTQGLSPRYLVLGKLVQTAVCLALAAAVSYGIWQPAGVIFLIFALIRQKRGSFSRAVGV